MVKKLLNIIFILQKLCCKGTRLAFLLTFFSFSIVAINPAPGLVYSPTIELAEATTSTNLKRCYKVSKSANHSRIHLKTNNDFENQSRCYSELIKTHFIIAVIKRRHILGIHRQGLIIFSSAHHIINNRRLSKG